MEYSDKQLKIMEVAEELFSEKGFEGTSVRDISDLAGVNLAMISYYFGSKDKLLEAVFSYRSDTSRQQLEGMLKNTELNVLEKFYQLIDYYIEKFQKQHCFHRIMAREQMFTSKGPISELILKMKRTNLGLVKQLVQEGQKSGEFRKDIDVSLMMATLIGTVNHVFSTQHYYREMNDLPDMNDEEFGKYIRKKLSAHLKSIFKATLTYEV